MNVSAKIKWFYAITFAFIIANAILMAKEIYWLNLLPVVAIIILTYFISLDKIIYLIVFCTPLSVNLADSDVKLGLSLPTEPMMIGVMLMFFAKLLLEGKGSYDRAILKHPVTIAIIINLAWLFITCFTSSIPLVSFKFLLARMWFITCFYFVAVLLFKNFESIKKFLWLFLLGLVCAAMYTIINHSQYGFDEETAHWVMSPLFNDHTSYGAILAMLFPIAIGLAINKESSNTVRLFSLFIVLFLTLAIILSYTRAAWVSIVAALAVYVIILLRVRLKYIWMFLSVVVVISLLFSNKLLMKMEKNRQDSSDNLQEHVASISNISSDASNLERLNRWACAIRMFKERPVFGWGPGTYSFQYAPFQMASERTTISTNAGDAGNAHSEYLGPLSEAGVLGTVTFFAIIILATSSAFKILYNPADYKTKLFITVVYLGLITYIVHGFLNNFLDTDKAAVPFWGFIAIIVSVDIYHKKKNESVVISN